MKLTVIGCGDAWGTAGRGHTCFRLDAAGRCVLVDFGASALVSWHGLGQNLVDVDAIVVSHLHGDHFGGLPFFLLQTQFETRRTRPLSIVGPPGLRERLDRAVEDFFPSVAERGWRFPCEISEVKPGGRASVAGLDLWTREVVHQSGSPATAIRLAGGGKTFAYSGDTEWTPALEPIADGADLFVVECYSGERPVPGHLNWPALRANLGRLRARRVAITHMGASALARADDMEAEGLTLLRDGLVLDV